MITNITACQLHMITSPQSVYKCLVFKNALKKRLKLLPKTLQYGDFWGYTSLLIIVQGQKVLHRLSKAYLLPVVVTNIYWDWSWPKTRYISVVALEHLPLCNHSSSFQHLICLFICLNPRSMIVACVLAATLLKKVKIDPHKFQSVNNIATVTNFNKLLLLLFNMNTVVSYHNLSLACTNNFCVGMLKDIGLFQLIAIHPLLMSSEKI